MIARRFTLLAALAICAAALSTTSAIAQGAAVNLGLSNHDSGAPVEITSESLALDQQNGSATFTGDVLVRQGEMTLSTNEMVVEYATNEETGQQEIDVIRMSGGVTFATQSDAAEAERAVYTLGSDTIVMTGSVLVTQGITAVAADKLTYNLNSGEGRLQGNVKTVLRQGGN